MHIQMIFDRAQIYLYYIKVVIFFVECVCVQLVGFIYSHVLVACKLPCNTR